MKQSVVTSNPDVMNGTAVFRGTRVPVQALIDYLESGESIDDFLTGFPSVTKRQVIDFLRILSACAVGWSRGGFQNRI